MPISFLEVEDFKTHYNEYVYIVFYSRYFIDTIMLLNVIIMIKEANKCCNPIQLYILKHC